MGFNMKRPNCRYVVEFTIASVLVLLGATLAGAAEDTIELNLRGYAKPADTDGAWQRTHRKERWVTKKTAVVVCDMWDYHHSRNATKRVGELAPRMNRVIETMRRRGALIVHAPSSCMAIYKDHPARKRAQDTPVATNLPADITRWCNAIPGEQMKLYPIDQSDGGDDDDTAMHAQWRAHLRSIGRNPDVPWKRQIDTLKIDAERDVISDRGDEIWNVMEQRGIKNVLVVGVHTNMCVLGRPFGLRQMAKNGRNVALVRDMTDTMYNPARRPFVSHYRGTDLVVEHIEKYVAPTLTSDQIVGGEAFVFKWDVPTKVVIAIAEPEYKTWETLPALAKKIWTRQRGYETKILIGDPKKHDIPGLAEALKDADVLVLSVRRQALPKKQLQAIRDHLAAGKPLLGIRTTSHAFTLRGNAPKGMDDRAQWPEFDAKVLGGNYHGHYPNNKPYKVTPADGAQPHPILADVEMPHTTMGGVYKNIPLAKGTTPLLIASIKGAAKPEPVAWVNKFGKSKIFYTSLGDPSDFENPAFEKLLWNAMEWMRLLPSDIPEAEARAEKPLVRQSWAKGAKPPREALAALRPGEGLAIDSVLADPKIQQPVFLNFDERGRMWVVEYRQYPHPAGLKIVSRDSVWRNIYDKIPPPPPHAKDSPFRGTDRISIHEDTDGDGHFETSKTFVDGLNMATSVVRGRGGVWVMNPPYLLFYADKNNDDVPDAAPVVHLKGFWLEDSHSIANSLRWGPDGWLYGAQGSTVTADIEVVGIGDAKPIHTQGQLIWRYHPKRRTFEVYAEGGGNAFGCEIDSKGRVFSGHNGGDTRGYHYVQGAYLRKGFNKHGALSNPYAFSFFPHMPHNRTKRFTHNFIIYEGAALPDRYRGKIIGVDPINRHLPVAERAADGATFRTQDVGRAITTDDPWFRPVDIKHGPDGSVYVADWYDAQVSHYRNHEGKIDKSNGRIYRIRAVDYKAAAPFDLSKLNSDALIALLEHPNRWHREQARRLLADRSDAALIGRLRKLALAANGQAALEYLWATNLSGGFSETFAAQTLRHADPYVRLWTVRLLGDQRRVSDSLASQLAQLAVDESHVEVRSQLAASCKRLPADAALPILAGLMGHDADVKDRYIPLQIWWSLEAHCTDNAEAIVDLFADDAMWQHALVKSEILGRLMRRFAATGLRRDLMTCAKLLESAPDMPSKQRLMAGFELAFKGNAATQLPERLIRAIADAGGASLAMRLRSGEKEAIDKALAIIADTKQPIDRRATYASLFGEVVVAESVPVLIAAVNSDKPKLRRAALTALQSYDELRIGEVVVDRYGAFDASTREVARTLLAGRSAWAEQLVEAVAAGRYPADSFPGEYVAKLRLHNQASLAAKIDRLWGKLRAPTPKHFEKEINRVASVLDKGAGDPYAGKKLYLARCAICHKLFADGGAIGPDLTSYQRRDTTHMLLNIINPNAEIREGYENYVVTMKDSRVVTGFKADADKTVIVIRGSDGQSVTLKRSDISKMNAVGVSMMPPGLLSGLTDQQLRDFFAYFRTTQPLVGAPR